MTRRLKLTATAALAIAVTLGGVAYVAKAGTEDDGLPRLRFMEKLTHLGVTDAQKDQIHTILRKHQPTVEPIIKQLVAERRALRGAMHAETIDEKAIRIQAAKVAGVEADLAVQRAYVAHEIRAVLTDEQIEKLGEMREDADARIDHFIDRVAKRIAED